MAKLLLLASLNCWVESIVKHLRMIFFFFLNCYEVIFETAFGAVE